MTRFNVFLRGTTRRKVTTVEAPNYDDAVKRVAAIRELHRDDLYADEVRERVREKCPRCQFERSVRKRTEEWQRPRLCGACDAEARSLEHAAAARAFAEKARRIRAARASRGA